MKYDPLISIITVCYNSEKYIKDTIESVLMQTYKNIEYIIIDGGSTDRTLEIVKRYEPKFKGKMRWISEKDEGLYEAMNKGISLAKGELIGIINSDDWYNLRALEIIASKYDEHTDIYYGDIYKVRKIDHKLFIKKIDGNKLNLLKKKMSIHHPSCFVNRKWYKKIKYDNKYKLSSDYKFVLESYINGATFQYVNFPFSYMRLGGVSNLKRTLGLKEDMLIRKEISGKKFTKVEYFFSLSKLYYYRLRKLIAQFILPKSQINKLKQMRGWKKYNLRKTKNY